MQSVLVILETKSREPVAILKVQHPIRLRPVTYVWFTPDQMIEDIGIPLSDFTGKRFMIICRLELAGGETTHTFLATIS